MAPTLWIDITELFGQFALSSHPTGISRVVINLSDALAAEPGNLFGRVRTFFWHPLLQAPFAVEEPGLGSLATFFPTLKAGYATGGRTVPAIRSGIKKGLITAIPKPLRFRLFPHLNGVTHFLNWARQVGIRASEIEFATRDCVFVPGSFWLDRYGPRLGKLTRARGARVVAFVHDLLLFSNPESLPPHHGQQFRRGLESFLPYCTAIVCNSAYTCSELKKHLGWLQNMPVKVCRLGDVIQGRPNGCVPAYLPNILDRRYALFVSTLTPRKNHRLALAAWQKLWGILGEKTPWLVLVGGGMPDSTLADMFARPATFGHRIVRLVDVDDVALEALYAGAWITIYPSLAEGYGLPVAESLARGKVCLASRSGGTEEVAPDLVDPISAVNPDDLVKRVIDYLADPDSLSAREQMIKTQYHSTRWEETAYTVRCVLEDASISVSSGLPVASKAG